MKRTTMFGNVYNQVILTIKNNPDVAVATSALSIVFQFFVKRWEADIILFVALFLIIIVNMISGIMRAKKEGTYSHKTLRDKTKVKVVGYMLWLICTYVVAVSILLASYLQTSEGKNLVVPGEVLHYPITLTYLFFVLMEALSIRKNFKAIGVNVPGYSTDALEKLMKKEGEQ